MSTPPIITSSGPLTHVAAWPYLPSGHSTERKNADNPVGLLILVQYWYKEEQKHYGILQYKQYIEKSNISCQMTMNMCSLSTHNYNTGGLQ